MSRPRPPSALSRFKRRPTCLAAWLLAAAPMAVAPWARALPQGAVLSSGQATVQLAAPGQMLIQQTSARAGLDWTAFSIAAGERVQVQQPSSSAVLLNRVLGDNPSAIYGSLSSNGNVWLINPRGIVFGAQSRVDVGGLVASTLSLSTADFAAGRLHLRADASATGAPAALVAEGQISAPGGAVVLVAPQLTQRGSIDARRVGLAAGSDVLVDVEGHGLLFFHVRNDRLDSALEQLGRVRADGGTVDIRTAAAAARAGLAGTVLNLEGVVQARSVGQLQGRIRVDGGDAGITRVAGRLDASAADTQGGDVLVQGRYIAVESSAVVDASGATGGGGVRIGGDFQGRNAAVRNAERVVVMAGAELSADSLVQGDGGRVVVWSDGSTRFLGGAHARGGPQGGDGGLVEVSGKTYLDYRGQSDRSAPKGRAGNLLLDPDNITVQLNTPDIDGASPGTDLTSGTLLFAAPGASSVITAGAVVGLLANGSVELQAQADISVTSAIEQPAGSHGLSLRAGNNITVSAPISVGGDIRLSAHDGGASVPTAAGRVEVTAPLTAGGTITITNNIGGTGSHRLGHNLNAGTLALTGDAELTANSTWTLASDSATTSTLSGAGALTKAGAGVLTLSGVAGYTGATTVTGGGLTLAAPLSSTTVDVNAGGLNLSAPDLLADTAVVSVAAGASLSISAGDTIGELVLRGTLAGGVGNTLTTTGATTLDGGTVSASLAANTLSSSGISALLAPVAVTGAATVTAGTLTIGSNGTAGSLSAAAISVLAGAELVHRRSDAVTLGPGFSVSGAGRFAQAGDGNLLLGGGAQQLATATIDVGSGRLTLLAGETDRIADTSAMALNGATLAINNASETIGTLALAGGRLLGSGELSTGALTSSGVSRIATSVRATTATVTAGVLTVGNNGATGELATSGALTVDSGALLAFERAAGADLTLADVAGPGGIVQRGGNVLRLGGTSPDITTLDVVSGTVRLDNGAGNRINDNAAVTVAAAGTLVTGNRDESVATLALAGTLGGAGALTANVYTLQGGAVVEGPLGLGELRVTGNANLNAPAASLLVNVQNGGSLTLGAAGAALSDAAQVNVGSGGTLSTTAPETVGTLNLAGTLSGAFALSAGSTTLQQGGLVSGTLGGGALVVAGTGTITGTAASGSIDISSGGTLVLGAAQRLTAPPSLRFDAGGRLTLNGDQSATTVSGTINVDGNGRLLAQALALNNSSIAVPLVTNTLVSDGISSVLSTVTVNDSTTVNTGVLTVGDGSANGALAGAGSITVAGGATLAYNRSDTVVLNNLLGAGTLRQSGSGELQLQGTAASPAIEVTRGAFSLAAGNDNRLADNASVRVDNGATWTLNNTGETVGSVALAGRLNGIGLLTAANVTLQTGAVVDASQGGGTLTVIGNSRLNATSGAQTVQVQAGTLTLGSAQRLLSTAVTTIDSGATLQLNGDQSMASLSTAGRLAGTSSTDTLLAAQVRLQTGAVVDASLGGGTLTVSGNSRLNATSGAQSVQVQAGTLTLGSAQRLLSTAVATIDSGATLQLDGDQSLASLATAGVLAGTSTTDTLLAAQVRLLAGASVNARLGAGSLTVQGNSSLTASAAANTVDVTAGTLTLGAAELLSNAATVTIGAGAGLTLGGTETVGSLSSSGDVRGSGQTLAAGSVTLNAGANIGAELSSPTLTITGNSTLAGTANATTVAVNGGRLTLAAAQRLAGNAQVTVAPGAQLALAGDEQVASLVLAGTLEGAGRTLTATSTTLNSGAAVLANLGAGPLVVAGNSSLSGTAAASTVAINNGATLTLGSAERLNPTAALTANGRLVLTGDQTMGTLSGSGGVELGAFTLHTGSAGSSSFDGSFTGSGNVDKQGAASTFTLTAAQAHTGTTTVSAGTLALAGGSALAPASALVVATGATASVSGAQSVRTFNLAGTLAGDGSVTADQANLDGGRTLAGVALGAGALHSTGASQLGGTATVSTVLVDSGSLTLVAAARLPGSPAVTVAAGASLALGGAEQASSLNLGGTLNGIGHTLTSVTSTLNSGAVVNANLGGGLVTAAGDVQLNGRVLSNNLAVNAGTLTVAATADRIGDNTAVAVAGGARLLLNGAETVAGLSLAGTLASNPAGAHRLTASGGATLLAGAQVLAPLGGPTLRVTGDSLLAASADAARVAVDSGQLSLSGTERLADDASVTVARNASLVLDGAEHIGTLQLDGTLQGSGTLSATRYSLNGGTVIADLGTGTLVSSGNSSLRGGAAVGDVLVDAGTLTLAGANRLTAAPALNVAAGASLQLQGELTVGALSGGGTVALDTHNLRAGLGQAANASSTYSGTINGAGSLRKVGAGRLVFNGNGNHSGSTVVEAGTLQLGGTLASIDVQVSGGASLVLGAAERLANTATVMVDGNGTLSLGGTETVTQLHLAGRLEGSGLLQAPTVTLDGATVLADLATGSLRSTGASQLAGTAAVSTVLVDSGSLTLAAAARLPGSPAVTVAAGASLALGGAEQASSLNLGGTLNGIGHTLTSVTSTLNSGAVVNANLGGGLVTAAGDVQLNGRVLSNNLAVNAGTLTVAATADRIGDNTAVAVAGGARLLLNGAETVAGLSLAGTLASNPAGAHRLTASGGATLLAGAQVLAPLGGPTLRVTGDSLLAASADAARVAVDSGQLSLSGTERLADDASVTVARNASLLLNGAERIGTLQLDGTLQGSGTLSATRYSLNGGTVIADLGTGTLVSSGNSSLRGGADVGDVSLDAGTLTLAGANRLTAAPALNVAAGASLQLQGELTVGALSGGGTVALDTHNLRAGLGQAANASSTYSGTINGAGSLRKVGAGRLVFNGNGNHSGSTVVEAGTLQLGGTLASIDVQVSGGASLVLGAAERLANTATVMVDGNGTLSLGGTETVTQLHLAGRLEGSGLLQAPTVTLDGATVLADLATGSLRSTGTSTLSGRAEAATVLVSDGSLALAAPGRLASTAQVTVARGATLQVGGDTAVASLTLAGNLSGLGTSSGTLSAGQVLLDSGSTTSALGASALRSIGSSTLGAHSDASTLVVESGTLNLTSAQATGAALLTTVNAGATLQLAASQTIGSLSGSGDVALGSFTLTTGGAGNSSFGGRLQGSGNLVKAGSGEFTLGGSNSYTGSTTVQAGTLTVGDGGTQGSLASSALVVDGTLKMARSDAVTLAQPISGSGTLEQAGSGRLTLAGNNKTYGGATRVNAGELATANAEALPDTTALQVATGASLSLSGNETLRSIAATGSTTLAGNVTASEDLQFDGPVAAAGNAAVQLSGRRISATHAGNRWGPLSLSARDLLTIGAGADGATAGQARDLVLGDVNAGNGGRIEAGVLTLTGTTSISRGTLDLVASAPLQAAAPSADATPNWDNKVAVGLAVAPAAAAVQQTGGSIQVASGAQLNVHASQGGSVLLGRDDNRYTGALQVLSGAAFGTPWDAHVQNVTLPGRPPQNTAVQSLVQVHGSTVNVGGRGIEADAVSIRATTLATPLALAPPAAAGATSAPPTIVARLPFDNTVGTAQSLPALTLWLNDAAFALGAPFGAINGGEIRIDVGSRAFGAGRSLALDAGYINVLPRGRGQGTTSVLLAGPQVSANGYRFFSDGAGVQGEIPVFYNGVLPNTPQVESSISATVSVSESARRERFEEAVRTENVAVRLRAGVIAEVGPGRPATQGVQGAQTPQICPPAPGSLRCELLVPAPR